MKKYKLEIDSTVYSFYGNSFDEAITEVDLNGKEFKNKLFLENKDKVVESEAEKEYLEAIEKRDERKDLEELRNDPRIIKLEKERLKALLKEEIKKESK